MQPLRWQTPEHEHKHHTTDWYWAVGIVAASIATIVIVYGNLLFAIVIILSAVVLSLHAARQPDMLNCEINDRGIIVQDRLYLYPTLESFWVEDNTPNPKLFIKSSKLLMPLIIIPLNDEVDPRTVRELLLQNLEEEVLAEPITQRFMEYLGF